MESLIIVGMALLPILLVGYVALRKFGIIKSPKKVNPFRVAKRSDIEVRDQKMDLSQLGKVRKISSKKKKSNKKRK